MLIQGLSHPTLSKCTSLLAVALMTLTFATGSLAAERKRHSSRVKIQNIRNSSDESTAERDRRLYRECQGRPNSGACLGYTQRPPAGRR
jgi:hypothetical protein